jgi:hypothetical protein
MRPNPTNPTFTGMTWLLSGCSLIRLLSGAGGPSLTSVDVSHNPPRADHGGNAGLVYNGPELMHFPGPT